MCKSTSICRIMPLTRANVQPMTATTSLQTLPLRALLNLYFFKLAARKLKSHGFIDSCLVVSNVLPSSPSPSSTDAVKLQAHDLVILALRVGNRRVDLSNSLFGSIGDAFPVLDLLHFICKYVPAPFLVRSSFCSNPCCGATGAFLNEPAFV